MKGTTAAPIHSGIGVNGFFFELHPAAVATTMTRSTDESFMLPSTRVRSIAKSFLIVNLCLAGAAQGHPQFDPVTVNRYWKLTLLSPTEIRLVDTMMFGAGPALEARRAADVNGDGRLDAAETEALGRRLQADVQKSLSLTLDGRAADATWEKPVVGLLGDAVSPAPFSVDLVVRARLGAQPTHELRLDDATDLPALGESEFRVEESPSTTLLASHRGPTGDEKQERIVFRGPKSSLLEDRSITVRFAAAPVAKTSAPAEGRHGGRPPIWPFAVGGLVLGLLAGAVLRRRYRNMNG
jgi:hypothetical protein